LKDKIKERENETHMVPLGLMTTPSVVTTRQRLVPLQKKRGVV